MTEWLCRTWLKGETDMANPAVRTRCGTLAALTGIALNILLASAKLVCGLITKSVAITADAANNFSDAAASIVTLLTVRLSNKPVDTDHPFGHGRLEYIGSLAVGVLVFIMGITLLKDSITSIVAVSETYYSPVVILLLILSALTKLWLYFFYRKIGLKINNSTILAASKDSLSDVLATSAVLLSVVLNLLFHWHMDGWIGIIVSLIVLKAGFDVCHSTIDSLLGGKPDMEKLHQIQQIISSHEGILGVHDLILHDYGPGRCFASAHAEVSSEANLLKTHEIIDDIEREIHHRLNIPICIHMDPIVTTDEEGNRLLALFTAFLAQRNLRLHDFRRVPGEKHTNLIFDVALPSGYGDKKQLMQDLENYAKSLSEQYRLVVQFDQSFE